ncbi:HPr family phosphocarrier protein [Massilioclostridium coli]|uniref:HPr family phosphocarrier protein n=1 Tax=Massilioclostridium coli TaxID=1870991 RepID=UPI00085CCC0E|nr:HPr family phosphocarrier protein [Massilioclostridium coli]PWM98448.1 MAG: HPr family phosphocarrier protein [Massilioclostridium sp.]
MRAFQYVIKDENGIHARPAGLLVKKVSVLEDCMVTIQKGERSADARKLFALMSLGVVCGDEITVKVNGGDEIAAEKEIKEFFEQNL